MTASSGAGTLEISVTDRGIGIAAADQARIFDPFYRAPDVVAAQIQGAGLGLSLVKRIVEAHAGRITLKSAPGEGSTFTVSLPVLHGDAAEGHDGVGDAAPLPIVTQKRILLIEDEPGIVLTLTDRLTREGYSVEIARPTARAGSNARRAMRSTCCCST